MCLLFDQSINSNLKLSEHSTSLFLLAFLGGKKQHEFQIQFLRNMCCFFCSLHNAAGQTAEDHRTDRDAL